MKRRRKFFYLTLFIHFFAFATVASTHVANDQDEISKEKLFAEDVAAAEVTVENIHETPLDKVPEETSNSEKPLLTLAA